MRDPVMGLVVCCSLMVSLGLFLVVVGSRHRAPRLADALGQLAGDAGARARGEAGSMSDVEIGSADLAGRIGAWAFTRLHLPLPERTRGLLALQRRPIGDFVAEKLLLAGLGLLAPPLFVGVLQGLGHLVRPLPVVVSLGCAVLGWFWPDIALRRQDEAVRADAGEALFTFFDLVLLERLANASGPQAMASAAGLSQAPLFVHIRASLERARLEQRPPWRELQALSEELAIAEIADMADVMRLDEQGAALADALRARVRELRDAHLLREKLAAQQVSERMTFWMVIPSLVFGLIFLAPPILKLMGMDA